MKSLRYGMSRDVDWDGKIETTRNGGGGRVVRGDRVSIEIGIYSTGWSSVMLRFFMHLLFGFARRCPCASSIRERPPSGMVVRKRPQSEICMASIKAQDRRKRP